MIVPLIKACQDPLLLGATLLWRAPQLELLAHLEGPEVTHAWNCSRQSGKSSLGGAAAVWNCTMREDLDALVPRGRIRYALIASPSEDQSREFVRICKAFIEGSPILQGLASFRSDRIDFQLPNSAKTAILAMPARDSSARGKTASLIVLDEAGHLADTEGPASDERLFTSLTPSTVVFGEKARILLASTPHGEGNLFHRIVTEAEGGVLPSARAVTRTIREMNPDISEEWLQARRAELGEPMYLQEYECAWLSGVNNLFDLTRIAFVSGPADPGDAEYWIAAADIGYHNDMTGIVLIGPSKHEPGRLLAGVIHNIVPRRGSGTESAEVYRAREDSVNAQILKTIEPYSPRRLIVDQHQAQPVRSYFETQGILVDVVQLTGALKTSMFLSLRARLENGSLRCWAHPQLVADLRRVRMTGADQIDLPRVGGSHEDTAMAAAMCCWEFRYVDEAPEHEVVVGRSTHVAEIREALDTDQLAGGSVQPALTAGLLHRQL